MSSEIEGSAFSLPSTFNDTRAGWSSARTFDVSTRACLVSTAIVGALCAWATLVPLSLRFELLAAATLAWLVTVLCACMTGVFAAFQWPASTRLRLLTLIGLLGIGLTLIMAVQIDLVRLTTADPDLTWNVDSRWALSQTQTIVRYGTLEHTLDYAGMPLDYHVGPAWIAAALQRLLGLDISGITYGLVPALATMSALIASIHLLKGFGASYRLAAAATGLAACFILGYQRSFIYYLTDGANETLYTADSWIFAAGLPPNARLALACGIGGLALLADRRSSTLILLVGAASLASLAQIKPQFLASIGSVLGCLAVARALSIPTFRPHSYKALAGCVLVVAIILATRPFLPRYPSLFDKPSFGLILEAYNSALAGIELVFIPVSALVLAFLLARYLIGTRTRTDDSRHDSELLEAMLLVFVALIAFLIALKLPVKESVLQSAADATAPGAVTKAPLGLTPMLVPMRFLIILAVIVVIAGQIVQARSRIINGIALALAALILASPILYLATGFADPIKGGYEAASDPDLHNTLRAVPRDGSILISNDLADPAENWLRPLRNFLLSAYEGHQFYLSNLIYINYVNKDAGERIANLRAFFGAPWSDWHSTWLARAGITHVILHDRCLPVWWNDREARLKEVAHFGSWSAFAVATSANLGGSEPQRPAATPLPIRYGSAGCL